MARPSYSTDQIEAMCQTFIQSTVDIIKEEGIDAVTIRRVAQQAGYKSATLYHYFRDLDHLLVFASLSFFKEYVESIENYIVHIADPYLEFISIWEMFCSCTFQQPLVFHKLFFGKHSSELRESIREFYHIFPMDVSKLGSHQMLEMLLGGNLYERNRIILQPLMDQETVSFKQVEMINQLMIFSYKEFLERKIREPNAVEELALIDELMDIFRFLLHKA